MIYVASSWRNYLQPIVVKTLRDSGLDVYDFRAPAPGDNGFSWREIDKDWKNWTPEKFRRLLNHPVAECGFKSDYDALKKASSCLLVMPCGRSAHLEAGYMIGAGKPTAILLSDGEPELMYKLASKICINMDEVLEWVGDIEAKPPSGREE